MVNMLNFKAALLILIVAVVLINETEAHPKLKLKLLKAKLIAPHVAAKVAVVKGVKAKTAIAAAKTLAAIKAKKVAALSIITAPIQIAKKTIALKVKKVKAVKAAKTATLAGAALAISNLKKGPLILPVPFAVPIISKNLEAAKSFGVGVTTPGIGVAAPGVDVSVGPVQGFLSGAQRVLTSAGGSLPILSTLSNGVGASLTKHFYVNKDAPAPVPVAVPAPAPIPVYRFVPEVGFTNYNRVIYEPHVPIEVPHPVPQPHIEVVATKSVETAPPSPHLEYGPPPSTYSVPNF